MKILIKKTFVTILGLCLLGLGWFALRLIGLWIVSFGLGNLILPPAVLGLVVLVLAFGVTSLVTMAGYTVGMIALSVVTGHQDDMRSDNNRRTESSKNTDNREEAEK